MPKTYQQFNKEMDVLKSMGYPDTELCARLLVNTNGNLDAVIDWFLQAQCF